MTTDEFAAAIAEIDAARDRARAAHLATLTPHVRRTRERPTGRHARALRWGQDQAALRAGELPWQPVTYCGAPITEIDWDRRTATARTHAASADRDVCPACLTLARQETR